VNDPKFVIQISKGLIRDQRSRRTLMFYSVLSVLVLIFAGSTLLWDWLREHPVLFIAYWGGCAWVTLLAVLLALYDMAKVRGDAVRERRRLRQELLGKAGEGDSHDPHAR
jgi:hypothetical protein